MCQGSMPQRGGAYHASPSAARHAQAIDGGGHSAGLSAAAPAEVVSLGGCSDQNAHAGDRCVSFRYESRPSITCLDKDGADGMVAPRQARRWMRVLTAHMRHSGGFLRRPNAKAPGLCKVGVFIYASDGQSFVSPSLLSCCMHNDCITHAPKHAQVLADNHARLTCP